MSQLANHINEMTNAEIVGIAKNPFLDAEDQVAVANYTYRLGNQYLASNPGLCESAANILWEKRGYALKTTMIVSGARKLSDKELHVFYQKHYKYRRATWGFIDKFFGEKRHTPPALIDSIFDDKSKAVFADGWQTGVILRTKTLELKHVLQLQNSFAAHRRKNKVSHWHSSRIERLLRQRLLELSKR